jgi:type IV secretory pathway VirB2 component (pilin)
MVELTEDSAIPLVVVAEQEHSDHQGQVLVAFLVEAVLVNLLISREQLQHLAVAVEVEVTTAPTTLAQLAAQPLEQALRQQQLRQLVVRPISVVEAVALETAPGIQAMAAMADQEL